MNKLICRALHAYRPLYLRGLLLDGQYRLPTVTADDASTAGPNHRSRRRALIAALVAAVDAPSVSMLPPSDPSPQELP